MTPDRAAGRLACLLPPAARARDMGDRLPRHHYHDRAAVACFGSAQGGASAGAGVLAPGGAVAPWVVPPNRPRRKPVAASPSRQGEVFVLMHGHLARPDDRGHGVVVCFRKSLTPQRETRFREAIIATPPRARV